jgi:hypothetical protein
MTGPDSPRASFPRVGTRLGDYTLERTLGQGGMGAVFVGVHRSTGARHAVKVLLMGRERRGSRHERFAREARALARIEPHAGVVALHSFTVRDDGVAYLVMDLVDGQDLAQALEESGPLPVARALEVGLGIARALAHVHGAGIVHRDLKPANVLLRAEDGASVLTDFGVARDEEEERITRSREMVGTPHYMAPEQALGVRKDIGAPTDVFAFGVTLYEALTGALPFEGETMIALVQSLLHETPKPPSEHCGDVPADLDALVLQCLSREAGLRPSAEGVVGALEALRRGEPSPLARSGAFSRALRYGRRHRVGIVLGALGASLVAVALGVAARDESVQRVAKTTPASSAAKRALAARERATRTAQTYVGAATRSGEAFRPAALTDLVRAREFDPEVAEAGARAIAAGLAAAHARGQADLGRVLAVLEPILSAFPFEPLPKELGDLLLAGAEALAKAEDPSGVIDRMELLLRLDRGRTLSTQLATWVDLRAVTLVSSDPQLSCGLACVGARANSPGFLSAGLVWELERDGELARFEASRPDDWAALFLRVRSLVFLARHRTVDADQKRAVARDALKRAERVRELCKEGLPSRVLAQLVIEELRAYEAVEPLERFLERAEAVFQAGHPDVDRVCCLVTDALQKVTRSAEEVLWGKRAVQALEEREIELQGGTVSADATPRGQLSVLRFRCYEAYARGLLKHGDLDAAEGVINTMLKYRLKPAPVARLRAKLYARRGDYPKALEVLDALPEPSTKEKVLRARLLREQGKQ